MDTWPSLSDMALLPRLSTLQTSLVTSDQDKKPFTEFSCISNSYMQRTCPKLKVEKIDQKTNTCERKNTGTVNFKKYKLP